MVSMVGSIPVLFGQSISKSRALEYTHLSLSDDAHFYSPQVGKFLGNDQGFC